MFQGMRQMAQGTAQQERRLGFFPVNSGNDKEFRAPRRRIILQRGPEHGAAVRLGLQADYATFVGGKVKRHHKK